MVIEPNNGFGTIDLNTGLFTQLGNSAAELTGLGLAGGILYGGAGNTLYQVNPANGTLTAVGSGSIPSYLTGSTPGGLFGIDLNGNLYSINPGTGATTLIGSIGFSLVGTNSDALSGGSSALYLAVDGTLYSVNTSTGAATAIGSTATRIAGLAFENGTLFAGLNIAPHSIDTLDTGSGAATFVANVSGVSGFFNFEALGPVTQPTATPEPSSLLLLATALVGFAAIGRRNL